MKIKNSRNLGQESISIKITDCVLNFEQTIVRQGQKSTHKYYPNLEVSDFDDFLLSWLWCRPTIPLTLPTREKELYSLKSRCLFCFNSY